jgi:serine/threonine protein kinase
VKQELEPGTLVDDEFVIVALLGEGGMGQVYKAEQRQLNRTVALKFLNAHSIGDSEALARFERESRVMADLRHRNIPNVFRCGVWKKQFPYISMEFIEGQSLQDRLTAGTRLDLSTTVNLAAQICDALELIHSNGFIHRDLKPNNILIATEDSDDCVKVLDFGLAGMITADSGKLTASGTLLGTAVYMSPEQCTGGAVDERSDIYALGCIMHECLAGEPPFMSENPFGLLKLHLSSAPPPLPKELNIPAELGHIISKCLAKKGDDRFKSAAALKQALLAVPKSTQTTAQGRRWSSRPALYAALILTLAAVSGPNVISSLRKKHHDTSVQLHDSTRIWQFFENTLGKPEPLPVINAMDNYLERSDAADNGAAVAVAHLIKALFLDRIGKLVEAKSEYKVCIDIASKGLTKPPLYAAVAYMRCGDLELKMDRAAARLHLFTAKRIIDSREQAFDIPPLTNPELYPALAYILKIYRHDLYNMIDSSFGGTEWGRSQSQEYWRKVLQAVPGDDAARYHYAQLCLAQKQHEQAKDAISEHVVQNPDNMKLQKWETPSAISWANLLVDVLNSEGRIKAAESIVEGLSEAMASRSSMIQQARISQTAKRTSNMQMLMGEGGDKMFKAPSQDHTLESRASYQELINGELRRGRLHTAMRLLRDAPAGLLNGDYFSPTTAELVRQAEPTLQLEIERECLDGSLKTWSAASGERRGSRSQ